MYDMDVPLNIMCMYDINVLDAVHKVRLGT